MKGGIITKGLKTQDTEKFYRFFDLIQKEAEKKNSIFFADAGDGNDFKTDSMEGENMMGWLIPKENEKDFLPLWENDFVPDSWSDHYTWAVWEINGDTITIHFEN